MQTELTLSNGVVVICRRIRPELLDLFEDAHAEPEPPKRIAEAIGGAKEEVDDFEDEGYKAELKEAREVRAEHLRRMVFDHVELKDEPSPEVLAEMERYGITATPEYLLRYSMGDYITDWGSIYREVLRLSTVTDEEVERALQRFRGEMEGATAADGDGDTDQPVQDE